MEHHAFVEAVRSLSDDISTWHRRSKAYIVREDADARLHQCLGELDAACAALARLVKKED